MNLASAHAPEARAWHNRPMDRLTTPVRKQEDRLQGRLVEIDSKMYLVTKVDAHTGFATLSFGTAEARRTLYMPIPEVFYWLAQKTREEENKPNQSPLT